MTTVFVEADGRLHFGMLDLGGSLGRRFGGIGAGVPSVSVLVSASRASTLSVTVDAAAVSSGASGLESSRSAALAAGQRMLAHPSTCGAGARISVHRVIPAHQGLGSGTQLALATARAVAELYDLPREPLDLAHAVSRGRRSAIGTYLFGQGGFILEGGRRDGEDRIAPLLARLSMPKDWRCVLALPAARAGLSGDAEVAAFATLPHPPESEAARVAHLVLMVLLPALVEHDFDAFGGALTELQRINGGWFAAAQGGSYAAGASSRLIEQLIGWGATGVGQSSWGPAVYALARDAQSAAALAARVRESQEQEGGSPGRVLESPFTSRGARVWQGSQSERGPLG